MFKPSNNPIVLELTKSVRDRSYNLSCLKPVKLQEINSKGKPKRLCAWCAEGELFSGNQKYCSEVCSRSAMAWAYPQKEDGLRCLLIRQDWKCAGCQYDYRPIMQSVLDDEYRRHPNAPKYESFDMLPWYYFERLKRRTPKGFRPEVDHLIPIYKGGDSLGLSNHNVLCYTCHKTKTKIDLSGKRIKDVDRKG